MPQCERKLERCEAVPAVLVPTRPENVGDHKLNSVRNEDGFLLEMTWQEDWSSEVPLTA
jgi:hypothetical protein